MIDEIQKLLDQYTAWLKDNTILREVQGWVEMTTPFLDRHNDCLRIYVRREGNGYLLSDGGEIIDDLRVSGCSLESEKRQGLLRMTLGGFGVQMKDNALEVRAHQSNFAQRKHNLVQAMLSVNDLFCLAAPVVASLFYEDVVAWLTSEDVRFLPRVKFTGLSGLDHHFDFAIPKSRKQPERIVQTLSDPSRNRAELFAFAWIDTKGGREAQSRAYALLNNTESSVRQDVVDALEAYDIHAVLWSERDKVAREFAA